MQDVYFSSGLRTPFVKAGGAFAKYTALDLSRPVAAAMAAKARPDFLIWGQVIPDPTISNIGRELVFEAGLDPEIPAFSTVMACSTSFGSAIQASGMVGRGGTHLALIGGVETMSHVPLALKSSVADTIFAQFPKDPEAALKTLSSVTPDDYNLPVRGWANRISGRSMGEHTEDTIKRFGITREEQDRIALWSHQRAVAGQDAGFFSDLVLSFGDVDHDTFPRRDTSAERLAALKPAFDPVNGSLTAGNSSPLTDGASSLWVADKEGLARLGGAYAAKLVDWEIAAMDFRLDEGILMAPARAIPRLLARHGLKFKDIALWEIHEAFAAQAAANVKMASDPAYRREKARVDVDLGEFPWDRFNPNGGSTAIGHPFAATGARILSQAVKELSAMAKGSRAIVSVCADGGQGTVALLEAV
ncbi:acetyl-CoA acetyltransferase [Parvibaculum lavamentivorans DS-1]|uniref:Acetyl-CoA acetyltransferase n=1 Tax=Parvibaculum lavamentivorans (strain DS-1 / DSM 13023 / NCIMB 13966) TaxID=402881 RepID=A7HPZ9_PARL1|nr:acetyl-CoA C-acyltransferase [Parvibaculum lavamentivorans]ABS61982.1 acetyl-CoA acetyltransferase [Parvibaculum lavamentivorans DS-1]